MTTFACLYASLFLFLPNWYAPSCLIEIEMKPNTSSFPSDLWTSLWSGFVLSFHICLWYSWEQDQEVGCRFGWDVDPGAQSVSQQNYLSCILCV
jgi:hypothetical protein